MNDIEEALEFDNAAVPNRILSKQAQQNASLNMDQSNLIQQQHHSNYDQMNFNNLNYNNNPNKPNQFQDMNYDLDTSNFENFKLITKNGNTKIVNGTNDDISEYEIPIIRYNDRLMQQYSQANYH